MTKELRLFQRDIKPHAVTVIRGRVLAIDPGSNTMGWALFEKGKLVRSGKISATHKKAHLRIIEIVEALGAEIEGELDAVCVEKLFKYNASLVWSVGAMLMATKPSVFIEVPIRLWKAQLSDDYVKDDEHDAIEIGKTLIHHANSL
jgi:hypothetical protein